MEQKEKAKTNKLDKREWTILRETIKIILLIFFTIILTIIGVAFVRSEIVDQNKKEYLEFNNKINSLKIDIKELKMLVNKKDKICVHKDTTLIKVINLRIKR